MIVYIPIISIPLIGITGYLFFQNRNIKRTIEKINNVYDHISKDYSELQNESIVAKHRLGILHNEFDSVLSILTSLSKEHNELQQKYIEVKDGIASISKEVETSNNKLSDIEDQVSYHSNYRNDMINNQEQLKNQVTLMLRDVKDDIGRINTKLDSM